MTNLDRILKSRDITLPTKVHLAKAMVFPVVTYGCENWTVKKAELWTTDVFEWCWRRLLRVPWTARISNQSILKEISPGCSLEGLKLKLKLQYFGHLMRSADSFEKTLILGGVGDRRIRGWQRMRWLDGITNSMHMSLDELTWLPIPGSLALGEWSHHHVYLGREDLFLYSSSVYSCHLFLISSVSVRSITFLSFIEPIFAINVPLVPLIFMKRSLVFPILLFSSISLHWLLRKAFLSLFAIFGTQHSNGYIFPFLLCFSLLFFSQLFVRPPQTAILLFVFLLHGMVLIPVSCTMPWTSVHSSSGTLSIRSSPLNLFLTSTV